MKNAIHILLISAALICLTSCKKNYQSVEELGTVEYYPKFLWKGEGITYVERTLTMNWNSDAKADPNCYAEYAFVDLVQNVIPTSVLEVIIDGKESDNNKFKVSSKQDQVSFKFRFKPGTKEGKHQGYLMLVNHNIHRQSGNDVKDQGNVAALQWQIKYEEGWNPLAKCLFGLGLIILVGLILWFTILQCNFYPRFRAINKTVIIPNQAPIIVRCKGYREIVLSNTGKKQGVWDKLIKGPILYKVSPAFDEPIRFKPTHKGKKILVVGTNSYKCIPNPIDGNRPAVLENISNKQKITIN